MNKICPIALIILSLVFLRSTFQTQQQTLAYSCGYLAGIQYTLSSKKEEPDYCKAIRLRGVKDGFTSPAKP